MTSEELTALISTELSKLRGFVDSMEASIEERTRRLREDTVNRLAKGERQDVHRFWDTAPAELEGLLDHYPMMYRRAALVFIVSYFEWFLRWIGHIGSLLLSKTEYSPPRSGSEMIPFRNHWVDVLGLKLAERKGPWWEMNRVSQIRNRIVHQSGTVGRAARTSQLPRYFRMREWSDRVCESTQRYIRRHPELSIDLDGRIDLTAKYLPGVLQVIEKSLEKLVLQLPEK